MSVCGNMTSDPYCHQRLENVEEMVGLVVPERLVIPQGLAMETLGESVLEHERILSFDCSKDLSPDQVEYQSDAS